MFVPAGPGQSALGDVVIELEVGGAVDRISRASKADLAVAVVHPLQVVR